MPRPRAARDRRRHWAGSGQPSNRTPQQTTPVEAFDSLMHGFGVLDAPQTSSNAGRPPSGCLMGLPGSSAPRGGDHAADHLRCSPTSGIIMLSCITGGELFAGNHFNPFNIPASLVVATTFEATHAQRGRPGRRSRRPSNRRSWAPGRGGHDHLLAPTWQAAPGSGGGVFAVQFLTFCSFVGMGKEPPAKILSAMMPASRWRRSAGTVTAHSDAFGSTELAGLRLLVAVIGLSASARPDHHGEGLAFKVQAGPPRHARGLRPGRSCRATGPPGPHRPGGLLWSTPGGALRLSGLRARQAFARNRQNLRQGEIEGGAPGRRRTRRGQGHSGVLTLASRARPRPPCSRAASDLGLPAGPCCSRAERLRGGMIAAVPRQRGRAVGPLHRAPVRRDPPHTVQHHRDGDPRGLRDRRYRPSGRSTEPMLGF